MICHKCGFGHMVDDSNHDVTVFKCRVCADRIYADHPKRSGARACSRCGSNMGKKNALHLCSTCLNLVTRHAERLKGRHYGEAVCG